MNPNKNSNNQNENPAGNVWSDAMKNVKAEKDKFAQTSTTRLLERKDDLEDKIYQIDNLTMSGIQDHLNLPYYVQELKDIKEEEEKRRRSGGEEYWAGVEKYWDTKKVRAAIRTTEQYLGDYFDKTCRSRLADGVGSIFEGIEDIDDMKAELISAYWERAEHPDVMKGCTAYKTKDIKGGHLGLLNIADLPDDVVITASDPKGTGKVSMTVSGEKGPEAEETWLIIGEDEGHDVIFTFHPGEPVRPSIVEVKDCPDGTKLTKEQAINMGFDLAKIV